MKKRCTKCGFVKPITEFHRNKTEKDGYQSYCKECVCEYKKEYRRENKDRIAKHDKEYREINKEGIAKWKKEHYRENKDEISKQQKEYYSKNKNRKLEYQKEYRRINIEEISKRDKEYYSKNKDKKAKYDKEYCRINKDRIKEYRKTPNGKFASRRNSHNRRALYKAGRADMTSARWDRILQSQGNKCNICHKRFTAKKPPTQDHIVPISKGGSLKSNNIQALCHSSNSRKRAKLDNGYIQTWSLI